MFKEDEVRQNLIELKYAGFSNQQLAEIFDVHPATISVWRLKNNAPKLVKEKITELLKGL